MDYSQVILATLFENIGNHTNIEMDENLIRHMFLMSLKHNRKKFNEEYGELVICCDSKSSWRRDFFPYYKANRKESRSKSDLDWDSLFKIIAMIKDELRDFFPYKVIEIDGCEADDIIGAVCHEYGSVLNNGSEKYLVLSGDKDYIQLHQYANVDQYSPTMKKFIRDDNPGKYLKEHILKGDSGDGVPNILSPDNCLVIKQRQKAMTKKRVELFSDPSNMDEETRRRFERNKILIDLSNTPTNLRQAILKEYGKEDEVGRKKLFNYFIEKKLKHLLTDIGDF